MGERIDVVAEGTVPAFSAVLPTRVVNHQDCAVESLFDGVAVVRERVHVASGVLVLVAEAPRQRVDDHEPDRPRHALPNGVDQVLKAPSVCKIDRRWDEPDVAGVFVAQAVFTLPRADPVFQVWGTFGAQVDHVALNDLAAVEGLADADREGQVEYEETLSARLLTTEPRHRLLLHETANEPCWVRQVVDLHVRVDRQGRLRRTCRGAHLATSFALWMIRLATPRAS